jgi:serine/threonine-protein kinase
MAPSGRSARHSATHIGRFRLTGTIGRGGMGMVYRARDEALERDVAVKVLTSEAGSDAESRRRFAIEAKAAARLQHPNILTVFELGEDQGAPFIAMELLPGADLETILASGQGLTLRQRLETALQVLRGLAYAHERGVVHRDIKPSNVRVLDDGSVKIMDFGIAKLQGTALTQSGILIGTVHYMSPEQIQGRPLDGRSDLFSVGVILYELLAGARPFPGDGPTEVLYRIVQQPPPPLPLPELPVGAGARLVSVVERALAKEPAERYASAAVMAEELAEVLALLPRPSAAAFSPTAATLRAALPELAATATVGEPTRSTPPRAAAAPRRARGLWLALAGAILGLAAALYLVIGVRNRPAPAPRPRGAGSSPGPSAAPAANVAPPAEVRIVLRASAPDGAVSAHAPYALDVVFKGRVVARGTQARAALPPGRHSVSLVAPEVFLRRSVAVEVRSGVESRLQAPGLGRLNVRATPDNCEVWVDGFSAGYLPILDRPIAAGPHAVAFRWPDGAHLEQGLEVEAGRAAFVTGRKP